MNILVTQPEGNVKDIHFPKETIEKLKSIGNVKMNDLGRSFTSNELSQQIQGIDICVTHWSIPKFTEEVLDNSDRLKMIAHAAGSVAGFITDGVYNKGIKVCSANTILAKFVAEGVLAYILSALRRIPANDSAMKNGQLWPRNNNDDTLFGKNIGLIGLGAVGRFLLDLLKPFDVEVRIYDPYINEKSIEKYENASVHSLDEVLKWAEIISLHAARTPETRNMISKDKLKLINDGVLFVNTARGALVDEKALADELRKGRFYAVLDVYEIEPLPNESPLRDMDNVILMPHRGGSTARERMTFGIIEEIKRFLNNEPLLYEIPYEKYRLMTR